MDDRWLHAHMSNILIGVEILWVGGVIAVIVFYLIMKRKYRKKKEEQTAKAAVEGVEEMKPSKE